MEEPINWFSEHGLELVLIAVISFILYLIIRSIISPAVARYVTNKGKKHHSKSWLEKRSKTLNLLFTRIIALLVLFVALFMILSEIGVDIGPLLAGAGVAGIAIGFGAQTLIKDYVNGLFIMLEDQYNVGDVVKVAGIGGLVEDVNLRRTVLRDLDGVLHSIPNSEVITSSNYTRDWARVNIDVPVAYGEDLDRVMTVINKVGQSMAQDDYFRKLIKTPPKSLRVNNFGDSGIDIKVLGDVRPSKQWEVTGELRRRLKKAFDEEGIEIPWPHIKLYFGPEQERGKASPATKRGPEAIKKVRDPGETSPEDIGQNSFSD